MDPFTNLLIVVSISSHDNQYAIWILTVIPHVRIIPLVTSTCNRTPFLDLAGKFGVTFSDDDALCAEFLGHGSRMGHEQYGVTSSSAMILCTRSLHFLENLRSPTDNASSTTRMSGRIDEENVNPSRARMPLE